MRKLLGTTLLALAFGVSTHAGDIPFGVTNPPPPPQAPTRAQETTDLPDGGEVTFGQAAGEAVLNLLGGVLSLL